MVLGANHGAAQSNQVANLLSFNDLVTTNGGVHMPTNYGGLAWAFSAWYYMPSNNVATDTYLALGGANSAVSMPGGQDFFFDGAEYWSRRGADANGSLYFYMMRDGVVVYDGREDNDGRQRFTSERQAFVPNYSGLVDYVAVVFEQGKDDWDHLAMDNLRLRTTANTSVQRPQLSLSKQPGGFAIQFTGIPGGIYGVECSTNASSGVWSQLGLVTADELGEVQMFDANTNLVQRYYRAIVP